MVPAEARWRQQQWGGAVREARKAGVWWGGEAVLGVMSARAGCGREGKRGIACGRNGRRLGREANGGWERAANGG